MGCLESDDTLLRTFRVNRKDIWYLHFIFEAYDGLGTVSTVDPREGIVDIRIPASRAEEAELLLAALGKDIEMHQAAHYRDTDAQINAVLI